MIVLRIEGKRARLGSHANHWDVRALLLVTIHFAGHRVYFQICQSEF